MLRSDGLADGADIRLALLQRRQCRVRDSIRHAGTALVKEDQPRGNDASRSKKRTRVGSSQFASRCETQPGTQTRSLGPSPNTWYAIETPSGARAYLVVGSIIAVCSERRGFGKTPLHVGAQAQGFGARGMRSPMLRRHGTALGPSRSVAVGGSRLRGRLRRPAPPSSSVAAASRSTSRSRPPCRVFPSRPGSGRPARSWGAQCLIPIGAVFVLGCAALASRPPGVDRRRRAHRRDALHRPHQGLRGAATTPRRSTSRLRPATASRRVTP